MRISELARAGGVPVPTVKFYLREGLLHPGRPTAPTQAEYDETHVRRLRLVRALVDVGGLPLASVKAVLEAVDTGTDHGMTAVGRAHDALPPEPPRTVPPVRARALVERLGWAVHAEASGLYRLEAALAAVEAVGLPASDAVLDVYAGAALRVAASDVATVPPARTDADPADERARTAERVRHIVVGTILYEPVLLALRRLAQQHVFRTGGR